MAIQHNQLTGADLHEPKGVASATINTVYVADGAGSGSWAAYNTYRTTKLIKTSDTSRNSTTTFSADPTLSFTGESNAKYAVRIVLFGTSNSTADFKCQINGPTGSDQRGVALIAVSGGSVTSESLTTDADDIVVAVGSDGEFEIVIEVFVTISSTSGTVALEWAQNTSNASNTTVEAGSYLEYQKVA